jgi:phosphotriesterase-related protein
MWPWTQSKMVMRRREFLAFIASGAAARSASTPVVETVRGPVPVAKLGSVLIHEHILVDFIGADKTLIKRSSRTRWVC